MKNNYKYRLTVVVPTYNRSQLLDYTLYSLTQQSLNKDLFEVIVADDGSTDNTQEIVKNYKNKLNLKYFFQEDLGYRPGSARNLGIFNSEGEICVFIDSGVILSSNCLKEHLKSYHFYEFPIAVIGYVYGFDQDNSKEKELKEVIDYRNADSTIRNMAWNPDFNDIREHYYQQYGDNLSHLPAAWIFFWTCNVSARTQDLKKIGGFDKNYDGIWGCEDNDLAFRLIQEGNTLIVNRQASSIHYPHGKDSEEKFILTYQNRQYFHQKFNTLETQVFLEAYGQECTDLNERILALEECYV